MDRSNLKRFDTGRPLRAVALVSCGVTTGFCSAVYAGDVRVGGRTIDVGPGRTLFVPAGEDHRFHDVTEDLTVLVFFAPAYTGRP